MPKKYIPMAEYRKRADRYFLKCDTANSENDSKIVKPYTLSGLLCEMGITKEQFFSLGEKRDGRALVNYLILKIEAFIEENALSGKLSASAAANSLKYSLGWCEKVEDDDSSNIIVSLSKDAEELGE